MKRTRAFAWVILVLCGQDPELLGAGPPVIPLTRTGRPSATPAGDSLLPILSGDGRWVAFQSGARNLAPGDNNLGATDVFVREIATGTTRLVSVNTNGASGTGASQLAGISRDGTRVLFLSDATDLVPGDDNEAGDVFVRDLQSNTTYLASANTNAVSGSRGSSAGYMTPDGRFVVFQSESDDLVSADTNGVSDVYVRDLASGTTRRVSVPSPSPEISARRTGMSFDGLVSDDGATVVFRSLALNLTPSVPVIAGRNLFHELYFLRPPATTNRVVDIFRRTATGTWPTVSIDSIVPAHALSADGRYVAFLQTSNWTNVSPRAVHHLDLDTGDYQVLTDGLPGSLDTYSVENLSLVLSADGQTVIFEALEPVSDDSSILDSVVYAWDAKSGERTVVSSGRWVTNSLGEVVESRFGTFLGASRDGNFVAFLGGSTHDAPNVAARQIVVRNRTSEAVRRVSRAANGAPVEDMDLPVVSFSDDGRRLVFQSASDAHAPNDFNRAWDVFLYDWDSDATTLISSGNASMPSATAFGDVSLGAGGVSGDGRYIAFLSLANAAADRRQLGVRNAYRMDRLTGKQDWVSVGIDGLGSAYSSSRPRISLDGRFVAFASSAENLVPGDTNLVEDVFLRDIGAGTTTLVNRGPDGRNVSGIYSDWTVSPDGRWVAFASPNRGLTPLHNNNHRQVYLFDRTDGSVTLASVAASGDSSGSRPSGQPAFSPDSRWLVFESQASNLLATSPGTGRSVYARRLEGGELRRVATPGLQSFSGGFPGPSPVAAFSPDGRFVATLLPTIVASDLSILLHDFEAGSTTRLLGPATAVALAKEATKVAYRTSATSFGGAFQIRVFDRATGLDQAVSAAPDGAPGNGPSDPPQITPDGRWVVFASRASNLVEGDANGLSDIFLKDLETGELLRLGGNSLSMSPILSADGRVVIFQSYADDLVEGDFNGVSDLFAVVLPGVESGYRITAITRIASGDLRLMWSAAPGRTYRVETAPAPTGPWRDAGLVVSVDGTQASADVSNPSDSAGFFRLEER
ncbi:MAG: hypothetical protein AB7O66_12425 [Limisphaerales bacterium]